MPVDLLKIPGVEPRRNRALVRSLRPRRPGRPRRPRRSAMAVRPRPRRDWVRVGIALSSVAIAAYLLVSFWSATRVRAATVGIADGDAVRSSDLADRMIEVHVDPAERLERSELLVDGAPVAAESVSVAGGVVTWRPGSLAEGPHEISLKVPRPVLGPALMRWHFTVDDTPPDLQPPVPSGPVEICAPVELVGSVEEGASLTLGGEPLRSDGGRFRLAFDRPPMTPLELVATDRAGNQSRAQIVVPVHHAGGQGVHVTAAAWGYEPLRRGVLDLVDAGLISVVQLDLKDEGGTVGYDSRVGLAADMGALQPSYRIRDVVADLQGRGVRVVGRIVAFRDPKLVAWAWANDRRDWVVQTPAGGMHPAYGGFANPAHPEVHDYNLAIAVEAVDAGIDDILWDYVRRPEGDVAGMVFPGLSGTPSDAVVGFLARAQAELRPRCTHQGTTVFGISADRPEAVAQDVARIARHVDYVSPMLYPSHWVAGEYGVRNPVAEPAEIVARALKAFQAKVAGTGAAVMPWLQDFTLGRPYGAADVRAQIDATRSVGINDWFLWNAGVRYTPDALDRSLVGLREL